MAFPNALPSKDTQGRIVDFVHDLAQESQVRNEIISKMEAIDIAYARYEANSSVVGGTDSTNDNDKSCGDVFQGDNIVPPLVVAQVDTYVAYLAEIFISGYPLFPVVSPPKKRQAAEKLEVLLDDHATLGGYVRQLYLMLKNGVKYNLSALEVNWTSIEQFSVESDFTNQENGTKVNKEPKTYNEMRNLDMYNTFWDDSVSPGDVSKEGDFAGYVELITKTKLKRLLTKLGLEGKVINAKEALVSGSSMRGNASILYNTPPVISEYMSSTKGFSWSVYLGHKAVKNADDKVNLYDGKIFQKTVLYARILPSDLGLVAPAKNTPQIWKFIVINDSVLIQAERIISAYDYLPILFGQPLEDGLGYQTKSVAEGAIPFQEAASTLFNIRFAASRRAVSDRALYNVDLLSPSDVNSKNPAAKIPVRFKALGATSFDHAYKTLPFDMRGTETTLSDARVITSFANELNGINNVQQGQFQKGNKSVSEFESVQGNSDNRLRMPALLYETQVFTPLKQIMALNIFQFGANAKVVSQRTGQVLDINIDELRSEVLSFRIADGYVPKSKLVGQEILTAGMNLIMNSPVLQQSFGEHLPSMFAHIMQLGGARDFDQYVPEQAVEPVNPNLEEAALQEEDVAPVAPNSN